MIDLHAPLSNEDRKKMELDLRCIGVEMTTTVIPFYGGELLCGGTLALRSLLDSCAYVHKEMISRGYVSERGDEFLYYACLAIKSMPVISPANAYAARCWTGRYYSVPRWEDLTVLHLPAEKVYSFPRAYRRLEKLGGLDSVWFERSCGLRLSRRPIAPRWAVKRLLDRVLKR